MGYEYAAIAINTRLPLLELRMSCEARSKGLVEYGASKMR